MAASVRQDRRLFDICLCLTLVLHLGLIQGSQQLRLKRKIRFMYIDPGAGSVAFQILGASVIAALSTIARVRVAVRGLLGRFRRK